MSTQQATSWKEHAHAALRTSGARAGGARDAVIDYLARQDCCVSAQEVFDGLREGRRAVGIASVYRALDQLSDLGLVHRVELGHGVTRFEPASPDGDHHHHLVCDTCGKVDTFDDAAVEKALGRVATSHGYRLGGHDLVLRGACADCA
jgi:Fur family ferric uptake transcriptional regulator